MHIDVPGSMSPLKCGTVCLCDMHHFVEGVAKWLLTVFNHKKALLDKAGLVRHHFGCL